MLGGPELPGLLKLTTTGVLWTSRCCGKGSPIGAALNSQRVFGWSTPGVLTLTQLGSSGGICWSQGTQPTLGSHFVSFLQSLSLVQGVSGTHTPCEQTCEPALQGVVQATVPPPVPEL